VLDPSGETWTPELIEEISASDYYADAYDQAKAIIDDYIATNGSTKELSWDYIVNEGSDKYPALDEYLKEKYGDDKGTDYFSRTSALVKAQLGNSLGFR
jgi:hypothetical protein